MNPNNDSEKLALVSNVSIAVLINVDKKIAVIILYISSLIVWRPTLLMKNIFTDLSRILTIIMEYDTT